MRTELALLPSPLLGPAVWAAVAQRLRQSGWLARVCGLPAGLATAQEVMDSFLKALPQGPPLVLVPHSNAGLFVPHLVQERTVVATVFVDAALPPAEGFTALAPAALYSILETRADQDGLLPPWTQWWDDADVNELFPSQAERRLVEEEQARLPLAYFRTSLQVPTGWADTPGAYIAFGDTYADERRQAERWQWPVETLPGRHLHMLVAPEEVATTLTGMLARLGIKATT
jgi:hypothetical protein